MAERPIDRRTFLKGGLLAGGALLGGGAAIAAIAKEVEEPAAPASPRAQASCSASDAPARDRRPRQASPPRRRAGGTAAPGGPNILVIVVDQLRAPQWFTASPTLARMLPNITAPAPRRGLLRAPLHGLQRLHAGARDAADRPLHPPDGVHDHGRQHAEPGLPDVGEDAARARLRHVVVRQVAPHARGQQVELLRRTRGRSSRYGFSGGTYPSPDGGPGQGWRVDPQIADQFDEWFAEDGDARSRGARRCRS